MTLKRDYSIDNIKGIMIFLVVLAHFFEFNITSKTSFLLIVIYSFHMPVFIYYSGYFAKYDTKKMVKNILVPYTFVQCFGYIFYKMIGYDITFRFVASYATLWYMISMFIWYISIPFIEKTKKPKLTIAILVLIGLLTGYDRTAGAVLSISRTLVFLPFFYLGFYSRKLKWFEFENSKKILKPIVFLLICVTVLVLYYLRGNINIEWFYGAYDYFSLNYNFLIRLSIYIAAFIWILFFKLFVPNCKTLITKFGKNSLAIYLLHYFIVTFIAVKTNLLYIGNSPILNCLILSVGVTLLLAPDWLNNVFRGKINKNFCIKFRNLFNRGV